MEQSEGDIRPIPRDPLRFELLQMFEAHRFAEGGSLGDPQARGNFIASLGHPLSKALEDPTLLRGLRAEALFEALVVSLGRIEFMKQEDAGRAWTTRRPMKIPDYRIVLPDSIQFLAEVKHFHQGGKPTKPFSISSNYLDGLRGYEDVAGCPVKLAVYWSAWNLWTLVPLSACEETARPSLTLERALQINEMGVLGDMYVGTEFPLRFRLVADTKFERKLGPEGEVSFTIGGVEMYCGDRRLTRKQEQSIAMWFMLYGSWDEEATAELSDGELVAVDFVRTPPEDTGEGFALVGALSSLFSSMYLSSTSEGETVTRLGLAVAGGSLSSLIPDDYESRTLPLWRLRQGTHRVGPSGPLEEARGERRRQ